jgi:hypothetical protein
MLAWSTGMSSRVWPLDGVRRRAATGRSDLEQRSPIWRCQTRCSRVFVRSCQTSCTCRSSDILRMASSLLIGDAHLCAWITRSGRLRCARSVMAMERRAPGRSRRIWQLRGVSKRGCRPTRSRGRSFDECGIRPDISQRSSFERLAARLPFQERIAPRDCGADATELFLERLRGATAFTNAGALSLAASATWVSSWRATTC